MSFLDDFMDGAGGMLDLFGDAMETAGDDPEGALTAEEAGEALGEVMVEEVAAALDAGEDVDPIDIADGVGGVGGAFGDLFGGVGDFFGGLFGSAEDAAASDDPATAAAGEAVLEGAGGSVGDVGGVFGDLFSGGAEYIGDALEDAYPTTSTPTTISPGQPTTTTTAPTPTPSGSNDDGASGGGFLSGLTNTVGGAIASGVAAGTDAVATIPTTIGWKGVFEMQAYGPMMGRKVIIGGKWQINWLVVALVVGVVIWQRKPIKKKLKKIFK